jgi:N utilization substance protein A
MTQISRSELILALDQIEREKGVKKEDVLHMIEGAMVSALRKHLGKNALIECTIDPETADIKAFQVRKVVETVTNPEIEISIEEARRIRPDVKLEEELRTPVATQDFSRIAAQTAKQVLIQKIRETERDKLYEEYKPREGEVVTGSVHRFLERNIIVDLGKTEAILPLREQIRKEHFGIGKQVRAVILKVDKAQHGPQVVLSRAAPLFLKRLFETEVPEVNEKVVEIVNIVRDPGFRSKVCVRSNNAKVDPVGACVGLRGSRIRTITTELSGERIDLILHHEDAPQFVANALAPAKVTSIKILDREAKKALAIVPTDQLSIAIGKDGQNIRLAAALTGWTIEVKTEEQQITETTEAQASLAADLLQLDGVGPKLAEILINAGVTQIDRLASATLEELCTLQGIGEKTARRIIASAKEFIAKRDQAAASPEAAPAAPQAEPKQEPEGEKA